MQEKKSTKTYEELPETITPYDYADWRGCGESKAREKFNSKDFPRIKGMGVKQIADKRAVLLYELGLKEEEKQEVLKEIARKIIQKGNKKMKRSIKFILNSIIGLAVLVISACTISGIVDYIARHSAIGMVYAVIIITLIALIRAERR